MKKEAVCCERQWLLYQGCVKCQLYMYKKSYLYGNGFLTIDALFRPTEKGQSTDMEVTFFPVHLTNQKIEVFVYFMLLCY